MNYKELHEEIQNCEKQIAKFNKRLEELNRKMESMPENLSIKGGISEKGLASKLIKCNGFNSMNQLWIHFKEFKTFTNLRAIGEKGDKIIQKDLEKWRSQFNT